MTHPRLAARAQLAASLTAAALATIAIVACRPAADRATPHVIVLGIDGMDYRVTRELMAAGRLPHLSELAAAGTFAPLATSMPPQSPVAWSTVATGLDPTGHGIFDFVHRDPVTLEPFLSTSRAEPARRHVSLGGWRLPLSSARITPLRRGEPFWSRLEDAGIRTTVIRMPANFPPSGLATRELSGMGTPDLLGTYGTFTLFTSAPPAATSRAPSGGRITTVDIINGVVRTDLVGPDHPFRTPARALTLPFTVVVDSDGRSARLTIGDETRRLAVGEWSNWVPVQFPLMPFQRLAGMCRFLLKQAKPAFQLYVSPINLDPVAPAMTISTPPTYAAELAEATGRFVTQGIAEDTQALTAHVLTRDEFLEQARLSAGDAERQFWHVLSGVRDGLLFVHFGNLDQVSHMFWRARDPAHPAYDAERDAPYRSVIDDLYVGIDRLVGETWRRAGPDTTVIVLSDHGFASWRRSFNLNGWLRDRGDLVAADPDRPADGDRSPHIDWTRTRAYGMGLNGLYLNLRGRERYGIVEPADRARLLQQLREALLESVDPATGQRAITRVFVNAEATAGTGPDLIVGYAEGTRVSNESALGRVPRLVFEDNISEWSGDHCMDPAVVPGILLANRPLRRPPSGLEGVAAAILAEFGVR